MTHAPLTNAPTTNAIDSLQHPRLRDLYLLWHARRHGERVPLAERFHPRDLRPWVANMVVMEIDGGRPVYAYYGANLQKSFGVDLAGQGLEEVPPGPREVLEEEYRQVCRSGLPRWRQYSADFRGRRQTWERLVLPLSEDGDAVTRLLVAAFEVRPRDLDGDGFWLEQRRAAATAAADAA